MNRYLQALLVSLGFGFILLIGVSGVFLMAIGSPTQPRRQETVTFYIASQMEVTH